MVSNQMNNQNYNESLNENEVKTVNINNVMNDLNQGVLSSNFPIISGYYGIILRKKKHPLFGSYWCKEYCSIQSNIFVCHELKYPFCITKSISIASIIKCEISIIDPCVFSITINSQNKLPSNLSSTINSSNNSSENKTDKPRNRKSCFCIFRKKKNQDLKFKCISTLDTQKWIAYINNSIKLWKSNKNSSKSLFNTSQYIEKTMAQEIVEKLNKKIKRISMQYLMQNLINIIKQHNLRQLYQSFNKLLINCLLFNSSKSLIEEDNISVTTYKSSTPKSEKKESLFKNDLLLIKRRIVLFKIEQGANHLNRIFIKKLGDYWKLLKSNIYLNIIGNNSIEIYFDYIKLRKIFCYWRILTRKKINNIEYLGNKYNKSEDSYISTDSMQTHYTNNNIQLSNSPPILVTSSTTSSEIISSKIMNIKHDIKYTYEGKYNFQKDYFNFASIDHEIYCSEVIRSTRTPKPILTRNLNKDSNTIKLIKDRLNQIIKLNIIILSKKRDVWNLLQVNRIQGNIFFFIYKYNQIQTFAQIIEKNSKLKLYKAFISLNKTH